MGFMGFNEADGMAETENTTETEGDRPPYIMFHVTEDLKQQARIQMAHRGFSNLSEYMRALIEGDEPDHLTD